MKITKKNTVIMMCTLAMVSMVPAAPVMQRPARPMEQRHVPTGPIRRR